MPILDREEQPFYHMAKVVSKAKMPANPQITEFDILPSRIENFRKRMNDIAKVSKPVPPIYFDFEEKPARKSHFLSVLFKSISQSIIRCKTIAEWVLGS